MNLLRRRPPPSSVVFFCMALVLSVGAAGLMASYARRLQVTRPDVGVPTAVLMAAASLPRGTMLDAGDVEAASVPASLVPPGSLTSPGQAEGRVLVADIARGEIVTGSRLARSGVGPAVGPGAGRASSVHPAGRHPSRLARLRRPHRRDRHLRRQRRTSLHRFGGIGAGGGRRVLPRSGDTVTSVSSTGPAGTVTVLADPATVEVLARAAATGIVSFAVIGPDAP